MKPLPRAKSQARAPPAKPAKKPAPESKFSKLEKIRKSEWSGIDLDEFELTKMLELCPLSDGKTYELRPVYFRREDSMMIRNPRPLSNKTRLENLVAQTAEFTDVLKNLDIPLFLYDIHLVKNCHQMTVISVNARAEDFMDLVFLPTEEEEDAEDELPEISPLFPDPLPPEPHQPQAPSSFSFGEPVLIFSHQMPAPQSQPSTAVVEEIVDEGGTTLGRPPKPHKTKKGNKSDNID